jgi:hypothetical protein
LPVADRARIGDVRIGDLDDREGNVEPKVPGFVLNKRHTREQVDIASREVATYSRPAAARRREAFGEWEAAMARRRAVARRDRMMPA